MLNCGRIKYTNDLPVYAAFDEGVLAYPGTLHADVPSKLNEMMLDGRLDVSPISAFAYAKDFERYVLLPDLCIGARDEVISVVLVSSVPPALLDDAEIAVSSESATGRNLLRVLLERRYGVHARFVERDDAAAAASAGHAALLIGDAAIDAQLELPVERVYDLGALWHDWSGEQTVFAVWAARREVYERDADAVRACMHALTDAYTWARGNMETVIARAQAIIARPPGFYENYYAKLNFTFHSAAQRGLAAYCRELQAIGAIEAQPPVVPEAIGVSN
jgi:chorismate dehydratase